MSIYTAFPGKHFSMCRLNMEIYFVDICNQSKHRKTLTRKNSKNKHRKTIKEKISSCTLFKQWGRYLNLTAKLTLSIPMFPGESRGNIGKEWVKKCKKMCLKQKRYKHYLFSSSLLKNVFPLCKCYKFFNLFYTTGLFLYSLKTLENQKLSDVFRMYRNKPGSRDCSKRRLSCDHLK